MVFFCRVSLQEVLHPGLNRLDDAGYFTLVEGAYRRLDCKDVGLVGASSAPPPLPMPGSLRVGRNVPAKSIISQVQPVYPRETLQDGRSCAVRLRGLLAKGLSACFWRLGRSSALSTISALRR